MKKIIGISLLPQEIDFLHNIALQLKLCSTKLSKQNEFLVDIKLLTSDGLTNWENSSIPKQYFIDKLNSLSKMFDWCETDIGTSEDILGCVSYRIYLQEKYKKVKSITWLDTDMIFDEFTLELLSQTIDTITEEYWILTPEIVKVWDHTWDCLTNKNFLSCSVDYQKTNDCFKDTRLITSDINVSLVNNTHPPSRLKFAGGWFTTFSPKIFELCPIPKSLGHYGLEDTFIMIVLNSNFQVQQYKIEGLVVAENYKYRDYSYITKHLDIKNRKEEFLAIANKNAQIEFEKIMHKV